MEGQWQPPGGAGAPGHPGIPGAQPQQQVKLGWGAKFSPTPLALQPEAPPGGPGPHPPRAVFVNPETGKPATIIEAGVPLDRSGGGGLGPAAAVPMPFEQELPIEPLYNYSTIDERIANLNDQPVGPTHSRRWNSDSLAGDWDDWSSDSGSLSSSMNSGYSGHSGSFNSPAPSDGYANTIIDELDHMAKINDDELMAMFMNTASLDTLSTGEGGKGRRDREKGSGKKASPTGGSGKGGKELDPKRAKRILANRQSAQRSRMRKLQYIEDLEKNLAKANEELSALVPELKGMTGRARDLQAKNLKLRGLIALLEKDAHQSAAGNAQLLLQVNAARAQQGLAPLAVEIVDPGRLLPVPPTLQPAGAAVTVSTS